MLKNDKNDKKLMLTIPLVENVDQSLWSTNKNNKNTKLWCERIF